MGSLFWWTGAMIWGGLAYYLTWIAGSIVVGAIFAAIDAALACGRYLRHEGRWPARSKISDHLKDRLIHGIAVLAVLPLAPFAIVRKIREHGFWGALR